jgi:hypothetical protein
MENPKLEKKEKKPIFIPPKKPKLSKAERRAIQEEQRAAKGVKSDVNDAGSKKNQQHQQHQQHVSSSIASGSEANDAADRKDGNPQSGTTRGFQKMKESRDDTLAFFSHLPPFKGKKSMAIALHAEMNNALVINSEQTL